jgi:hypothetical protein
MNTVKWPPGLGSQQLWRFRGFAKHSGWNLRTQRAAMQRASRRPEGALTNRGRLHTSGVFPHRRYEPVLDFLGHCQTASITFAIEVTAEATTGSGSEADSAWSVLEAIVANSSGKIKSCVPKRYGRNLGRVLSRSPSKT